MIISRIERIATIVVAILMMGAASAYLYMVETVGLPSAGYTWADLSIGDRILISLPTVFLMTYAVLLLIFYRKRGVRVHSTWTVQDGSDYRGQKYPWM